LKTVFVGGSRAIGILPDVFRERLGNIVAGGLGVLVGDAPGADKAVQAFFAQAGYRAVTVFSGGAKPRNNLGGWSTRVVEAKAAGFEFHAAKDRAMAAEADFGLMMWDGVSPGTILNVLRMVRLGKPAVLTQAAGGTALTFKTMSQWDEFFAERPASVRRTVEERMIPAEQGLVGAAD
jgi:hypothetical protein